MTTELLSQTPAIGDRKRIGTSIHQWTACCVCREARWVRLENGVPRSKACRQHDSPETKERKRLALLGHICPQETRDKISKARMGHIGYMLGKHLTEEQKKKVSVAKTGSHLTETTKEKLRQINLGRKCSEETRAKLSLIHKGRPLTESQKIALQKARTGRKISEETRERLRLSHLGQKPSILCLEKLQQASRVKWMQPEYRKLQLERLHSPESRKKATLSMVGHPVHSDTRAKISSSLMGHGFTDETRLKWQKSMKGKLHMRPNQAEKKVLQLLNSMYPSEWSYVGDWSMILAGKNPDFVNINGKKLIVELFGDFWHKGENPEDRIALFSKFGYKTLVIWERELKNLPKLTERVQEFVE